MKKSCTAWLVLYLAASAAIAWVIYRRYPVTQSAVIGGLIGGFLVWIGLGWLAAIRTKFADAGMVRQAMNGEPASDGDKIAVIGTVEAISATLTSPLSRTQCVAYKYTVTARRGKNESTLYDGMALVPSQISSQRGPMRILAYPDLQVQPRVVPREIAAPNMRAYAESAEFKEPKAGDFRALLGEMMEMFKDDDGSIHQDMRMSRDDSRLDASLNQATFREWIVAPGDQVCAIGRYSLTRGGLVPDPESTLQPLIIRDAASASSMSRSVAGAIGNFVGAAICIGLAAAALLGFFAFVPLWASEQMSPALSPTWREIRFERLIERKVRGPMRKAGMLNESQVSSTLPVGVARGRVAGGGREEPVSRATLTVDAGAKTIHIDDEALVLTINNGVTMKIFGETVETGDDLELEILSGSDEQVVGRLTYFREGAQTPAARVEFNAMK